MSAAVHSFSKWTFTTIHEPVNGDHPVSGNRDFGFTRNSDGSYTFYTRGVDRLTDWFGSKLQDVSGIPFSQADALWTSFQNKINSFVKNNGGQSSIGRHDIFRPNWQKILDVIAGKKDISSLNKDCR